MNLTETRRHVDRLFARRDLLNTELDTARTQAVGFTKSLADHKEALPVLIAISSAYRRAEVARIQKAVSMALQAVFGRAYEFKLKQVPRRGQVELEPLVVDGTMELDLEGVGGGIKDIVSLVLRVVLWSKQAEATDPVILLDEPARCVNTPDAIRQLRYIAFPKEIHTFLLS